MVDDLRFGGRAPRVPSPTKSDHGQLVLNSDLVLRMSPAARSAFLTSEPTNGIGWADSAPRTPSRSRRRNEMC